MNTPHDPFTPHPRTVLWMTKERGECQACQHCDVVVVCSGSEQAQSSTMRCKATKRRAGRRYSLHEYCIDAREPGQPCGPAAQLFVPKKARK